MESKIILYDNLLCVACLSSERPLQKITDDTMLQYYTETLNEIQVIMPDLQPSMCSSCTELLKKAVKFREQIKISYKTLLTYPAENLHKYVIDVKAEGAVLEDVRDRCKPEPDMSIKLELKEDCENTSLAEMFPVATFNFSIDDVEKSLVHVKCDDASSAASNLDDGFDSDKLISELKKEKKRVKRKPKRSRKVRPPDEKIITVELTYEQMLKEREVEATRESYVSAAYRCESCVIGFTYRKSYNAHEQARHAPELGNYSCPVCKTVVASVESFTAHYKRHMRRYECSICKKRTMDIKVMHQHYYSTHAIALRQYTCRLCGKTSNSVDAHRYHRESHKARVKCADCEKTFSHRAGLTNHRLSVHERQNYFPCHSCGKEFRWKASLLRHAQRHNAAQNSTPAAKCISCDISFASVSSYQRHLRNSLKHVSQDDLRFICDVCGRRFADKTKLRDHIEEKHLHRTYTCNICNKPSKNRVSLDQHVRNVHKGRPNNKICHHCGKGFPTKVQLESHLRTHTGERPFICEFCPTTFSQQSNLYKHYRQVHVMKVKPKRGTKKDDGNESCMPATQISIPTVTEPMGQVTHTPSMHYSIHTGFVM